MTAPVFHALVPGAAIEGDWYPGRIPGNIEVGPDSVIDSSFCFKHYFATGPVGLRVGRSVTIWRTSLAAERGGIIEIGDYCYLSNASLVCSSRISIGSYVMLAGGVTVADSDFHPMDPAERLADSVAVSPIGDRRKRPLIEARPVIIEDDVWVGFNAVILKGVRIGAGAMIEPGAVVAHDVPPGATVSGNPARVVERDPK